MIIEPAAMLHSGSVMHRRHTPMQHHFSYRMWMLSVDLDRLDEVAANLFRHNRAGLVSVWDQDHGARDGSALRPWVERQLAAQGLSAYAARIRFMMIPRVLGYAFNPIAFYFCRDEAGRLGAVLHQVKNTFGGQHAYLLPVAQDGTAIIRQRAEKRLHVSPFFDMDGGYRFAFHAPIFAAGGRFALSIRYGTAAAPRMTATMNLRARVLTDRSLLGQLAVMPLMPMKVVAAIHWQALRLWLRGARYHPVPPPILEENA
jgi:DUF1365 family protein